MKEPTPKPSRRKTGPWVLPPPWLPAEWEMADYYSLKALQAGTATAEQQKRALKWIIVNACATYDLGWHPDGAHQATFAAGRRFPGLQIVTALNTNLSKLRNTENA